MNKHGGDIYSYDRDILDFSVNINPLGISRYVIDAIVKSVPDIIHYPDTRCRKLRKAIAKRENTKYENVICSNGAADLIYNIVQTIMPQKVLLVAPSFSEYELAADSIGAEKAYYCIKEEFNFEIREDITEYIDEKTDMVFICNPNNPTGICTPKKILAKVAEKCRKNKAVLVIDECFMDFAEENEKNSLKNLTNEYGNIIIIKAFTKLYAMPGIRLGYGICSDTSLLDKLYSKRQPWSVSLTAQEAGLAALRHSDFISKTAELVKREREYICNELKAMNIHYINSTVNYVLIKSDINLFERLLDYNILIRDCSNYRGLKKGFYRIAVKNHKDNERLVNTLRLITGSELNG